MATIDVGVDLGTRNMAVAARFIRAGESPDLDNIALVWLPGSKNSQDVEAPQKMFYSKKQLLYGKFDSETRDNLELHPRLHNRIMELPKLALHTSFNDWPEVAHVHKRLGTRENRGALQDLFADLFRCLARDVLAYFREDTTDTSIDFDNIQLRFQVSVPVMWEDKQLGMIHNAAKSVKPGTKVELREEPLCAATAAMLEIHKKSLIKEGQCALLIDVGGGTSDITMCMMAKEPIDNQMMELKRIGMCEGGALGSHLLNNELLKYIQSGQCPEVPDLKDTCDTLRMTKRQFLRLCSEAFDDVKPKFDQEQKPYSLTIHGNSVGGSALERTEITLRPEMILGWYKKWVDGNKGLLREFVDYITKYATDNELVLHVTCAIFTGKGLRSTMLDSALRQIRCAKWNNIKIPKALSNLQVTCARGILMHHLFQLDSLRSCYLYIAKDEIYDSKNHADVTPSLSQYDHKRKVVKDCLNLVMRYDGNTWQRAGNEMIPMVFRVECQNGKLGRLHLDICHSDSKRAQFSPLTDQNGNILAEIRRFPLFFTDIGDLSEHGFLESTAEGFEGDGDIAFDEDELDDEEPADNEKDGDYQDDDNNDDQDDGNDDQDDGNDGLEGGGWRRSQRLKLQKSSTSRPSRQKTQPMQDRQRTASPDEDDDMEEPKPALAGTRTESTNENGDEDDEMRDVSENEEDEGMSKGDEDGDVSSGSDEDDDDDMSGGSEDDEDQGKDKPYFLVKSWIHMSATADDLDITLYLMKPYYKYRWERSQRKHNHIGPVRTPSDLSEADILLKHTDTVWSNGSSHFVSKTTGTSGPRDL